MADNIKYRFIQNVGDFFPSGYFGEDFIDRVQKISGYTNDQVTDICSKYVQFRRKYDEYKNRIVTQALRPKDSIRYTHEFHTELLKILGYGDLGKSYNEPFILDEERQELIPVRHILRRNGKVQMLVMEMRSLIKVGDEEPAGLFEQQYAEEAETNKPSRFTASHWSDVFTLPEGYKISPAIVNKAISRIFLLPEDRRPSYILMCAGNTIFLFDKEKWNRGSYLSFTLDDLFSQASISAFRKYYALFHMLVCKETLSPQGDSILMDALVEDSYKNAYEVTKDLKEGVVSAVETLANEALWFWQHLPEDSEVYNPLKTIDYTDDTFESEVKDDCLVYIYRLLFLFYAESRTELDILPTGDEVYEHGYSLEMLRDLEQVRLISEESKRGYFFDASLKRLFSLLSSGHKENQPKEELDHSFCVRHIDSPMFDDRKLHHLGQVRFRNEKWQQIICALSLSRKQQGRGRGRISYSNLGVNQLGSVYESLLAYRGFYAEEDYIEVHKAGKPEEGTFLVPYSRMDDFESDEILRDDDGNHIILKKGTFVYRLNGRDRQKSASYYTPEILTRSTVKYTLKAIIDEVAARKRKALDLLDLKILEPAMGAAAFQNEVINQLAEAYLQHRQEEKKKEFIERGTLDEDNLEDGTWRIAPDHYRDELQKVKAYIATHNVYGVDLNPTAIELGKLSLWLNVIHKDMETPFFSNRLALGNAVIGAWLKVYSKNEYFRLIDVHSKQKKKLPNPWWEKSPHKVKFFKNKVNRLTGEVYHFLLPDKNMLAVRNIAEQKKLNPEKVAGMNRKMKGWLDPIDDEEYGILQRICRLIDWQLLQYYKFQRKVERLTQNKMALWGVPGHYETETFQAEKYETKERLNDMRMSHDNAYFKLKMVMDYWCALWFWDYDDAEALPTRREYWSDIEELLKVNEDEMNNNTRRALKHAYIDKSGQLGLFPEGHSNDMFMQEALETGTFVAEDLPEPENEDVESEIVQASKEDMLKDVKGEHRSFFDESKRFKIVAEKYASRYRFFHPMLEFLEVFWLRDGFDIICGNPPWLKLEFDEKGIISEKYPEVAIRTVSAPKVREMRNLLFVQSNSLKNLYLRERHENTCSIAFMNSICNYPLLIGQQTNLYKCVIENGFSLLSSSGYMGLLHPETVYDDPKGQILRKELYHRLYYHFQYRNEFSLFADVGHTRTYSTNVYGEKKQNIQFSSIHNLFTPNSIETIIPHDGHGTCPGIKVNGEWCTLGHKNRLVKITENELAILSKVFENGADLEETRLVSIHSVEVIEILRKLSLFSSHLKDFQNVITEGLHETNAVDDGIMVERTELPTVIDNLILNGVHLYVSSPYYQTPQSVCKKSSQYDIVDLNLITDEYIPRTNFVPKQIDSIYKTYIKGFSMGQDASGVENYDNWINYYKVGMRKMLDPGMERTLIPAIIPPEVSHTNGIISVIFQRKSIAVELTGLLSSLVMDFFIKTAASQNMTSGRFATLPLGINSIFHSALLSRTLMLNCITRHYSSIWSEVWEEVFCKQTWSIEDSRLKPFSKMKKEWSWETPLRNYFERRQALIEIDVIVAMALGLSLKDLEMIYTIQFPVLQQNENDTWYDRKGNIVFTCSKGLAGVGVERSIWRQIQNKKEGETYVHTIEKSELYRGQQVTYYAPFTRQDRIEDYRTAWRHFEKIFNKE